MEEIPLAKGKRCFSVNGFSLHCNTSTNTHARDRLEKLIEYIARGPLSNVRLEITDDDKVKLQLKKAWRDGTSHLLLTPQVEKRAQTSYHPWIIGQIGTRLLGAGARALFHMFLIVIFSYLQLFL